MGLGDHDAADRPIEAACRPIRGIGCGEAGCTEEDIIMRSASTVSLSRHEEMRVATWNIAAVNNNPFEYWVSHPDPAYNMLMESVQEFIDNPGHRDVPISEVFDEGKAVQLFSDMRAHGMDHEHLEQVEAMWNKDYCHRSIVGGFLKDSSLGKKRLASMPDRITNTIHTSAGHAIMRPTVINYFEGDMATCQKWWEAWRKFVFRTEVELVDKKHDRPILIVDLLERISAVKYPALSADEETISIPLQVMCLAIFDAILLHMINSVAKDSWQGIRASLGEAFRINKDDQVSSIILETYGDCDIVFIQEAAGAFVEGKAGRRIGGHYHMLPPAVVDGKRDQNCLVLLRKLSFKEGSAVEITDEVLERLHRRDPRQKKVYVPGDLAAFTAVSMSGHPFLLASFHGDTNGLASIPVVQALHEVAQTLYPAHTMVLGLDANTYKVHSRDYQGVKEFHAFVDSCQLGSCWGASPDPLRPTTCNARTYLQPQLNKAIRRDECLSKADKNLKDWILFRGGNRTIRCVETTRDNTGTKHYLENQIFPTTQFPSDHALVASVRSPTLDHNPSTPRSTTRSWRR